LEAERSEGHCSVKPESHGLQEQFYSISLVLLTVVPEFLFLFLPVPRQVIGHGEHVLKPSLLYSTVKNVSEKDLY
jgi:hypothetical protein